jgi:hypothetical protein
MLTGGVCSTILTEQKSGKCWSENLKEGDNLGDQGRDGGGERCTGFIPLRAGTNGTVAVSLIMSYQAPENVEFLEQLSTYQHYKDAATWQMISFSQSPS